ncbi:MULTISPECIES: alanine racemase [Bacillaceae]|uniref:Alanine racemase n=1 Tax=Evansella alkalicola TaxID=745819 RepID=A0ABS6JWE2_9BACI|nr:MULTISPECIES: alanine racemase [Bacillaceae]MBU9722912.1 alanine racemase [Bacillus alkalicola]
MKYYSFDQIETPALIVSEEKLKRNIERMIKVRNNDVEVRPHFKTHKSVSIAKMQLAMGAIGITVATVSEAELLLTSGLKDILVAFPLSDRKKINKLLQWNDKARIIFTIDNCEQADIISSQADGLNVKSEVWIKVNCGLNRCGVEPEEETLALAKYIIDSTSLNLTGLYTHAGHSYGASTQEAITKIAIGEAESIVKSAELCEKEGIYIKHRSVGSTPTFEVAAKIKGITEVRPGNAVFFDGIQVELGVANIEEVALTVLATIASIKSNRLIIDAGSKALTTEKGAHGNEGITGFGRILNDSGQELLISRLSEEHGIVELAGDNANHHNHHNQKRRLNDKIHIIPNHACPVVNLYDYYYLEKADGKYEKFPVDGRGKSQ